MRRMLTLPVLTTLLFTACTGLIDGDRADHAPRRPWPPRFPFPTFPAPQPTPVTAADGETGIHPGTAVWDSSATLPAHQHVRPMAPSTRLAPTPLLDLPTNETTVYDLSAYPSFQMPRGLWSAYDAAPFSLDWKGRADLQMTLLGKGWSHVESQAFRTSGNGGNEVDPPMLVGAEVPYDQRVHFVTQNWFEGGASQASHDWIYGALPRSAADLAAIVLDGVHACDDSKGYLDGMASQVCILDIERYPTNPADGVAWQHVKRQIIDGIQAQKGHGPFAADFKIQVSGEFYDADLGGNGQGEDLVDETGYYKMMLWSGSDVPANYDDPVTFAQMVEFWNKQGGWAAQILSHHEYRGVIDGIPVRNMFSWIAPYHEDVMPYMVANPDRFMRYYKLRPDVAEGTPIWTFMSGAQGYVLWNDMNPIPWVSSEQDFIKGNWRIAQHPEMFTATSQFVVPEISFDGGVTWRRQRQGSEWVKPGDNLGWTLTGVDQQTKGWVAPLNAQTTGLKFNPDEIDPVRVLVRAVVNNGKILVCAQDSWQTDETATRDIMVRYGTFTDTIRLYGREISLGKGAL